MNKKVPDIEVVENVPWIALCNQVLNHCLCARHYFMGAHNFSNLLAGAVVWHRGLNHASALSTGCFSSDQKPEMICSRFRQQSLISDYLPQQLASVDNLYQERLTEHVPKRV